VAVPACSIGLASAASAFGLLQLGDLRTRRVDKLRVGVGVPRKAPPTFDRLGKEHPGPRRNWGISGRSRDQVGELADNGKLLLSVERARIGEDLHPDVVAVSIDVREGAIRRSCMNAAVLLRNIGMSGTCSIFIRVSARSRASDFGSLNVPTVA